MAGDVRNLENSLWWAITVPQSLMLDDALSLSARYLYMQLQTQCGRVGGADGLDSAGDAGGPGGAGQTGSPNGPGGAYNRCAISLPDLMAATGIGSKVSLRQYRAELIRRGWLRLQRAAGPKRTCYNLQVPAARWPSLTLPAYLMRDLSLPIAAKCLYAFLTARNPAATTPLVMNQTDLADGLGVSTTTVRRSLRQLEPPGWVTVHRGPGRRTNAYLYNDVHRAWRQSVLERLRIRLRRAPHRGEALMREMLNVLVDDNRFEDNARPGFLRNPLTQELLEFDRWYVEARVAFEFNGPQHYRTTEKFPDPVQVRGQRARDLIKTALVMEQGIRLITVLPAQLSFDHLIQQIGGVLPLRKLRAEDPVVGFLVRASRAYRRRAVS